MDDLKDKAVWMQILRTSVMRMIASRETYSMALNRMEQTRKAISRSQETIRKSDEFLSRVMPISN